MTDLVEHLNRLESTLEPIGERQLVAFGCSCLERAASRYARSLEIAEATPLLRRALDSCWERALHGPSGPRPPTECSLREVEELVGDHDSAVGQVFLALSLLLRPPTPRRLTQLADCLLSHLHDECANSGDYGSLDTEVTRQLAEATRLRQTDSAKRRS